MAEHHPANRNERITHQESAAEKPQHQPERGAHSAETQQSKAEKFEKIEQLRQEIESHAKSRLELKVEEEKDPTFTHTSNRDIKEQSYQRTLKKVRSHLSPASRTFSRVVHQPIVETVSEFSSKTVARPSAFLGAGITAFVGSGVVLLLAKRYGFNYNFFVFVILLVGGFFVGLIAEFILRVVRSKKRS